MTRGAASAAKVGVAHYLKVGFSLFALGFALVNFGGGLSHLLFGSLWLGWMWNTVLVAAFSTLIAVQGFRGNRKRWAAKRIQVLGDNGLPAPPMNELVQQYADEQRKIADARQAWLTGCNTPAMQGKRAGDDKKTILPLQNLRTDANMAVWAEVSVAGGNGVTAAKILENEDVFRDLTPGCIDFECRKMNGTGHRLQLIWHYKARYDGVVRMADVPAGPEGTLAFGVRPDGSPAWIPAQQGVSLYGLTRRGKSFAIRAFMIAAQRAGIPVEYRIADLKARGFQMSEFDRDDKGVWKGNYRVADYQTTVEGTRKMLHDMVVIMRERGDQLRGKGPYVPSREHPLLVFIADETLPLHEIMREGFKGELGEIGFSGAALGVLAWMNVQLTDKAATGDMRDLTPGTLCFGVKTQAQMEAALGNGAAAGGAKCHLNPPPGVGWKTSDSDYGWDEFKVAIVTDDEIRAFAENGSLPEGVGQTLEKADRWCAVYVLPNVEDQILYVGKAVNPWGDLEKRGDKWYGPGGRFAQHAEKSPWFEQVDPDKVVVYWKRSEELALLRESALIDYFAPKYNDQQNRNNPQRIDWRRDGYVPLESTVPVPILAAEKAQRTRRARILARVKKRTPKPSLTAEPVPVDEVVSLGELFEDDLTAKLRAARRKVAA